MEGTSLENGNLSQENFEVDLTALEQAPVGAPVVKSVDTSIVNAEEGEPGKPVDPEEGKVVLTDSEGNVEHTLEIDERFRHLPEDEGIMRTYQSKADVIEAAHNKLLKDTGVYQQDSELLRAMSEDTGLLIAFVNQIDPKLLASSDPGMKLKEQLKTEFGEEFQPTLSRDEAERTDPGGTDWKYYNRLDVLSREATGNSKHALTVDEYLKTRKAEVNSKDEENTKAIEQAKRELKMSDAEVTAVTDWGMGLKFPELVRVHRLLRMRLPHRNPNIEHIPGDAAQIESQREKFLKETLGTSKTVT